MGWEDRPYYRERGGSIGPPSLQFLNRSVPLFTAMGIRVRAHLALIVFIAAFIIIRQGDASPIGQRVLWMGMLLCILLLHEFGHCLMARHFGGEADEIVLWPLGGLAVANSPRRALPRFVVAAAGPMLNAALCAIFAGLTFALSHPHIRIAINPFAPRPVGLRMALSNPAFYSYSAFVISDWLMLFNLLPIYPMDGGHMLQAVLWPQLGFRKSTLAALMIGMISSLVIALFGFWRGKFDFVLLGICCFMACYSGRARLRQSENDGAPEQSDYLTESRGTQDRPRRRRAGGRALRRARRIAQAETAERELIGQILSKVSARGMASLTWLERRTLRKATERQRRRETELSQYQ